jgi:hypothetical protein
MCPASLKAFIKAALSDNAVGCPVAVREITVRRASDYN